MSLLFTLQGFSSTLSIDFNIPIHLESDFEYGLALLGFHTYNSVPNIDAERGDNKFYYFVTDGDRKQQKSLEIPTGSYEIETLEEYIVNALRKEESDADREKNPISIKANNSTLKCEIYSDKYMVDFLPRDSIAPMLGFSRRILKPGQLHTSDTLVNVVKVRTIHIDCNVTSGAYYKNRPAHTIYEFAVSSDPGYAIDESPKNLVYMPVAKREINNLTITILDQNFQPVNFRGEEIIVRLELKRIKA